MTVMATTTSPAVVRSPPTTAAPTRAASSEIPSARSSAQRTGRSAGAARPTVSECAVPPIALMSERFAAAAFRPMSVAWAQSRRKCRPSTRRSVETTTWPFGVRSTAASSPGPTYTCSGWPNRLVSTEIRPNSPASASVASAANGSCGVMPPSHQIDAWRRPGPSCSAGAGSRVGCEVVLSFRSTEGVHMVVQAYILIQTDVGKAAEVAQRITDIKGVILAEDVTGPYDVIVRAEARNVDELGKLVVAKVQTLDGITRTLTCPVVHI